MRCCVQQTSNVYRGLSAPMTAKVATAAGAGEAVSWHTSARATTTTLTLTHRTPNTLDTPYTLRTTVCRYPRCSTLLQPLRHIASTSAVSGAASPSSSSSASSRLVHEPVSSPVAADASQNGNNTSGNLPDVCLLCDSPFSSWHEHCLEPGHIARTAICSFFVLPERSESLMQHLERHIALDLKEVDALAMKKVKRRRRRLLAGLLHLVEEGVLKDSLPGMPASTDEQQSADRGSCCGRKASVEAGLQVNADLFLTRLLLGESYMRREVIDRSARLVPTLTHVELNAVVTYLMSTRQLARMFDELSLHELIRAYADRTRVAAQTDSKQKVETGKVDNTRLQSQASDGANGDAGRSTDSSSPARESGNANAAATGSNTGLASHTDTPASTLAAEPGVSSAASTSGTEPSETSPLPVASPATWKLSRDEKAAVLLACIGELEHFHRQDRPRSVSSKLTADALVLNVVATHARDNVISELIHESLQRMVEEGSPVWLEHEKQVRQRTAAERSAGRGRVDIQRQNKYRNGTDAQQPAPLRKESTTSAFVLDRSRPLSPTPYLAAAPSTTSTTGTSTSPLLDAEAAERLISSYVVFQDVDSRSAASPAATQKEAISAPAAVAPAGEAGVSLGPPVYVSGVNLAPMKWTSMEAELKHCAMVYQDLQICRPFPRLRYSNGDPNA